MALFSEMWFSTSDFDNYVVLANFVFSIPKWDFYEAVRSPDLVLTIQTADQALWANLLLTVGVRTPDQ